MLTRIITGIAALAVFVPVLFFSHTIIFDIVIAIISLMGTLELIFCLGVLKKYAVSVPSAVFSFIVPVFFRYIRGETVLIIFIFYLFYLLYTALFLRKSVSTNDAAVCFFAAVFVTLSFTSIIAAKNQKPHGDVLYLLIFIGAWVTDTFAYFTGKIIGRHKLPLKIREVSPNKTIEGVIGGALFCSASFSLFGFITSKTGVLSGGPDYMLFALAGLAVSVVSILGDLSMSAIKRNYGLKDFGSIFPGHGGILDRFDSVMAVAPAVMIIGLFL